jgi:hypothetical protein
MATIAPEGFSRVQRGDCGARVALRHERSYIFGAAAQQRTHIVNVVHPQTSIFFDKLDILLSFFVQLWGLVWLLLELGELLAQLGELLRDEALPLAHQTIIAGAMTGDACLGLRSRCDRRALLVASCTDHSR